MKFNLKPCPFCGGSADFHRDAEDCPDGCHYIMCSGCGASVDLSHTADPHNIIESLVGLQGAIAVHWNGRV